MTKRSYPFTHRGWLTRSLMAAIGAGALVAAFVPAATTASAASQATIPHIVKAGGGKVTLHRHGTVNLAALAKKDAAARKKAAGQKVASTPKGRETPLRLIPGMKSASAKVKGHISGANVTSWFAGNVKGEHGFDGITAAINGGANSPVTGGIGDVSPPDQGLAVGPSTAGTALLEFVNMSAVIYSPSGKTLLGAVPAAQIFGLAPDAFLSDPRAYWDPQTGHWFLTMFTFGDGVTAPLSTQYIAVSTTRSPFGPYAVFSIDTSDSSNTAGGCPCLGDFDQVGSDNSGFYIATNEFSVDGPNFNGSVLYAMSKSILISAARGATPPPVVQRYVVSTTLDPFAAYHLSPSTVTQGSGAPNTEYFVESNSNLNYGTGLELFALLRTARLNSGGRPTLAATAVSSENYSFPPNALQKSGPTPYGCSVGFCGTASLQTDFNAVQEVTYASGRLYAELDTGFNFGTGQNSGAAWFVLKPSPHFNWVSASLVSNGYVKTSQNILYPVIGVNKSGKGFMAFAISGPKKYPSAAYVTFNGASGPVGPIHIAARGVNPLDDFTCYPPFSTGQCRYGDYSMAQNFNGQIYQATEYVAPQPRDILSNWSTRIWYAPVP
jgi:hypothetical protein